MKNGKTRATRARELLERIRRGPGFSNPVGFGIKKTEIVEEAARQYKCWADCWIVDELIDLVPELRKESHGNSQIQDH